MLDLKRKRARFIASPKFQALVLKEDVNLNLQLHNALHALDMEDRTPSFENVNPDFQILLADDDPVIRLFLSNLLESIGFRAPVVVSDGRTAIEKLLELIEIRSGCHLILADENMPGLSGLELLRFTRSHEAMKHIPFFLITGESTRQKVEQSISLGITDFLSKPISPFSLVNKLKIIKNVFSEVLPADRGNINSSVK